MPTPAQTALIAFAAAHGVASIPHEDGASIGFVSIARTPVLYANGEIAFHEDAAVAQVASDMASLRSVLGY